jgi:DNA topoisomerase VI subunit A
MKYFKDTKGEFFGVDFDQEFLIKADWVEVTKADIDAANAPTSEQLKQQRISELKSLLADSDYKVLPDYDKPDDGVRAQRQAWREEIRQLEE